MSVLNQFDTAKAELESKSPVDEIATAEHRDLRGDPQPELLQRTTATTATVKVNLDRRRFLLGSAIAGVGGAAAAALHDGELGAPPQTIAGSVPWQEGTADAPPGVSGSGYVFFEPAEVAFIESAVAR